MAAMALALLFARAERFEDLVQYMAKLFAGLLPPVALPMIAGLLSKRTSNAGALAGFFLGAGCGVAAYLLGVDDRAYLRSVPYLTWITLLPTAFGLVAGSLLAPNPPEKRRVIAEFLEGLRSAPREKVSLIASGDAAFALRIIGTTVAMIGTILAVGVIVTAGISQGRLSAAVGLLMAIAGGLAALVGLRLGRKDHSSDEV
jgi:hypothetical protein